MPEIVVLDGYTLNPGDLSWSSLEALGHLTVYDRIPNNSEGRNHKMHRESRSDIHK